MIFNDSGYVLHTRPYRESSQLTTVITRHHGRFNLVSRGGRAKKGGNQVRPFVPLQITWQGKTELKQLTRAESDGPALTLVGQTLYVGFYLNELLVRMLQDFEPCESLFECYAMTLRYVAQGQDYELALRLFEFHLLEDLGYGLTTDIDAETGDPVKAGGCYRYVPDLGVVAADASSGRDIFSGHHLLAIAANDFVSHEVKQSAKRLTRLALAPHLGSRPLMSRQLFLESAGVVK
jgi:DNA repair protein RecO (recombination protein O)